MSLNKETYKRIKIAGLVFFMPFMLAAGPVAGFFVGSYLHQRFAMGHYIIFTAITIGLLSSFMETVRIIKIITKAEREG